MDQRTKTFLQTLRLGLTSLSNQLKVTYTAITYMFIQLYTKCLRWSRKHKQDEEALALGTVEPLPSYTLLSDDDVAALRCLPWKTNDIIEHTVGLRGTVEALRKSIDDLSLLVNSSARHKGNVQGAVLEENQRWYDIAIYNAVTRLQNSRVFSDDDEIFGLAMSCGKIPASLPRTLKQFHSMDVSRVKILNNQYKLFDYHRPFDQVTGREKLRSYLGIPIQI